MTLTDEQIEALYVFCREHYVTYYDVQVELVDHMASSIEQSMAADPKLTFDQARQKAFKGFGYKGFSGVVEERTQQAQIASRRRVWKFFLSCFSWPKMMQTLLILTVLYCLQFYLPLTVLKWVTVGCSGFLVILEGFLVGRQWLRFRKPSRPLLMMQKAWPFQFTSAMMLNVYYNLFMGLRRLDGEKQFVTLTYDLYILAFVITLALILAVYDTKRRIYVTAREKYPAAFPIPAV